MLDEVEQRRVAPVEVLEDERDGRRLAHPLDEEAPGCEQICPLHLQPFAEAEQVAEHRLHPLALAVIGDVLPHHLAELRRRALLRLVLRDSGSHAHHLGERPECDAFAVRETATAVPRDVLDETVEMLLELPGQP